MKYEKMLEKDQAFDFLQGLNKELDEVCGCLLGTKPFPCLHEAFAEVCQGKILRHVTL